MQQKDPDSIPPTIRGVLLTPFDLPIQVGQSCRLLFSTLMSFSHLTSKHGAALKLMSVCAAVGPISERGCTLITGWCWGVSDSGNSSKGLRYSSSEVTGLLTSRRGINRLWISAGAGQSEERNSTDWAEASKVGERSKQSQANSRQLSQPHITSKIELLKWHPTVLSLPPSHSSEN